MVGTITPRAIPDPQGSTPQPNWSSPARRSATPSSSADSRPHGARPVPRFASGLEASPRGRLGTLGGYPNVCRRVADPDPLGSNPPKKDGWTDPAPFGRRWSQIGCPGSTKTLRNYHSLERRRKGTRLRGVVSRRRPGTRRPGPPAARSRWGCPGRFGGHRPRSRGTARHLRRLPRPDQANRRRR